MGLLNITTAVTTNTSLSRWSIAAVGQLSLGDVPNGPQISEFSGRVIWSLGGNTSSEANATVSYSQGVLTVSSTGTYGFANLPNSTSGVGTVTFKINRTTGGVTRLYTTDTGSFTVNVPSTVKPTIGTMYVNSVNTGGISSWTHTYIQNVSKAKVTWSGVSVYGGASISSVRVTSSPSYINTTTIAASGNSTSSILSVQGNVAFTLTVIDSRGRTASNTVTINVQNYSAPKLGGPPTVFRCTSAGVRDDTGGTRAAITVSYTCSDIKDTSNVSINNIVTQTIALNGKTTTIQSGQQSILGYNDSVTPPTSLDVNQNYTAVLTLTDTVGKTLTYNISIPSAAYIMHIRKNGHSMGIGGAAGTSDDFTVHFGWKANFKNGIKVGEYDAAKLDYAFYSKVNELGQTAGSAKIVDVWDAMPTPSMMVTPVSQFASTELPASGVSGMVVISKSQFQGMGYVHFYGKTTADGEYYMTIAATAYNAQSSIKPSGVWHSVISDTGGDLAGDLVFKNGNGKGIRINTANNTNYVKLSASGQVVQLLTDATQSGNPTSIFSFDLANKTMKTYWKPWGIESGGHGGTTLDEAKVNLGFQSSGQAVNINQPTGKGQVLGLYSNVNNTFSSLDDKRVMFMIEDDAIRLFNVTDSVDVWRFAKHPSERTLTVGTYNGTSDADPTCYVNGFGVVMIRVSFKTSGSFASGATISFKLNGLPTPLMQTTGAAYNNGSVCVTRLDTDGTVYIRNTSGGSISSGAPMSTSFTYMS